MPSPAPPSIARRFILRARLLTIAAVALVVAVASGGAIAMASLGGPREGGVVAYAVAVLTITIAIVGLAVTTAPRARALRVLAQRHPDAVVVLARRLPAVVSDMPQYLAAHGLSQLEIGPGWYVAVVDGDGIGVFGAGRDPQRLLTIPWDEIGEVAAVRGPTISGDARWSVTVDVKPYVVPLTVDVGYAWGIVTMPMDARDTRAVAAAVSAQRPQRQG